ncbi:MAG: hypothetical protein HYX78_00710 [Armatimonadetes bacterium]|nr:hypothetical protein [Armatimonadota bacterium]
MSSGWSKMRIGQESSDTGHTGNMSGSWMSATSPVLQSTVRRFVAKVRNRDVEHYVPLLFDPGADFVTPGGGLSWRFYLRSRRRYLRDMRKPSTSSAV